MERIRGKALGHQRGNQAGLLFLDIQLIGIAARREECHGIAGQKLILRVGGAGADGGHIGVALNGLVLDAVDIGHIGHVGLNIAHHRQIRKALVHNYDHVGRFPLLHRRGNVRFILRFLRIHALANQRGFEDIRGAVFLDAVVYNALDFRCIIAGGHHEL